ncbi:MAG: hypothetical protein COB62_08035 [Piscirickettsiaceae bacterium]|nr:MAG: hypothetical protein COB62_08035 [Piscirickettsiaceae bacterium]
MKKIIFLIALFFPTLFFAQSLRDINAVVQKTIDLHALKKYFNESERSGETPLIILNDDKIPNNLIVFKFNKRVKIMTPEQLETFKSIYKGSLDPYKAYLKDKNKPYFFVLDENGKIVYATSGKYTAKKLDEIEGFVSE